MTQIEKCAIIPITEHQTWSGKISRKEGISLPRMGLHTFLRGVSQTRGPLGAAKCPFCYGGNMSSKSSSSSSGIGFVGLLAILFIALKLLGIIDWSWMWVLSPLWISTACAIPIIILGFAIAILKVLME